MAWISNCWKKNLLAWNSVSGWGDKRQQNMGVLDIKESGVAVLTPDKADFRARKIIRNKGEGDIT